ncbi:hypothetical protein [Umezawaea sp. Da 62-37]|uniref:hypothetical protein n=1 Tax=Umezawaea sp. Da 62-37 TaxID=3075927 RepID=UPI0028F7130B|nr:hypothetical protein [Umezawaea sp. Da 62-37]WNV83134.1 hypothetical protein RM788_33775 [Umezawaea sp. Da 62-37]
MGYVMQVQANPGVEQTATLRRGFTLGTTRLCQAMVALGMAHPTPVPQFPYSDHLDRDDFRDDQPVTDRAHAYLRALEQTRTDHGSRGHARLPGIPVHKLASGDGWHVTAQECREALAAYQLATTTGTPHPAALGDDVLPFLRTAARHNGFRTH